jgi:hypothetical protein
MEIQKFKTLQIWILIDQDPPGTEPDPRIQIRIRSEGWTRTLNEQLFLPVLSLAAVRKQQVLHVSSHS